MAEHRLETDQTVDRAARGGRIGTGGRGGESRESGVELELAGGLVELAEGGFVGVGGCVEVAAARAVHHLQSKSWLVSSEPSPPTRFPEPKRWRRVPETSTGARPREAEGTLRGRESTKRPELRKLSVCLSVPLY